MWFKGGGAGGPASFTNRAFLPARSDPSFRRKPEPRSQSEAGPFLDEAGHMIWVLTFVRMTV